MNIELLKVYQSLADQLITSSKIASTLHELADIKSSGNEVEIAIRNVVREVLPKKYHLGHGHIVDKKLRVSRQYDLVLTEGINFNSLLQTKDSTELFYYETVYAIGEIKKTWNAKNLLTTVDSIRHLRESLVRNKIGNNTLISGSSLIQTPVPLTDYEYRNPIFIFASAISFDKPHELVSTLSNRENWAVLPNITMILSHGIYILVNLKNLASGHLTFHLYPEFAKDDPNYEWRFIKDTIPGKNLAYLIFALQEHLSNTVLEHPPFMEYSTSMLEVNDVDILSLNQT